MRTRLGGPINIMIPVPLSHGLNTIWHLFCKSIKNNILTIKCGGQRPLGGQNMRICNKQ